MVPQAYKTLNSRDYKISGYILLSRVIHVRAPTVGYINGDVQSDISTLTFNNKEQLEDFHSTILIFKEENIPSG